MGATDRPTFRTDLVARPVEDAGHRFIEVTDPDSGHSFRFYEVEYAIACAMDGDRDVDGLANWARIELGLEPSFDELRTVIGTLGELGYLEGTVPRVAERPAAERPGEPPPLDRPPPAGRTTAGPSPFDFGMDSPVATPLPGRGIDLPPDLSTDLSQHSPVLAADVKEAVRQSRAMQAARAPEPNPADDDAFDEEQTPIPMGAPARAPAAAAAGADPFSTHRPTQPPAAPQGQPGLSPSLQKTLLGTAPAVPAAPAGGFPRTPTPTPMVLPEQPSDFNRGGGPGPARPTAPAHPGAMGRDVRESHPPPGQSASAEMPMFTAKRPTSLMPYLIVLLLLTAAGLGAYWWFFVYQVDDAAGTETVNETPPSAGSAVEPGAAPAAEQPAVTPPAPPAEILATLEAGPAREQEVVSPRAGRVVWVAPSGEEVAEGAPVAKFDGFQPAEYAVKEAQDSQRNYQEKLDKATAEGDKEAMKTAEGNVKRKQRDIDRRTAELEEFLIKAPVGGVVEPAIKPRTNVTKDQSVAKILAPSEPRATFALPEGKSFTGSEAQVASKSDPSLKATCKVEAAEVGKVVVVCPTDSGLASGTQIVLTL